MFYGGLHILVRLEVEDENENIFIAEEFETIAEVNKRLKEIYGTLKETDNIYIYFPYKVNGIYHPGYLSCDELKQDWIEDEIEQLIEEQYRIIPPEMMKVIRPKYIDPATREDGYFDKFKYVDIDSRKMVDEIDFSKCITVPWTLDKWGKIKPGKKNIDSVMFKGEKIYYVCPGCFNVIHSCSCENLPPYIVSIDGDIYDTIKLLNKKGYFTKHCCQGHWRDRDENSIFAVDEAMISFWFGQDFENMNTPKNCFWESGRILRRPYMSENEEDFKKEHVEIMQELYEWAQSLPDNPYVEYEDE